MRFVLSMALPLALLLAGCEDPRPKAAARKEAPPDASAKRIIGEREARQNRTPAAAAATTTPAGRTVEPEAPRPATPPKPTEKDLDRAVFLMGYEPGERAAHKKAAMALAGELMAGSAGAAKARLAAKRFALSKMGPEVEGVEPTTYGELRRLMRAERMLNDEQAALVRGSESWARSLIDDGRREAARDRRPPKP